MYVAQLLKRIHDNEKDLADEYRKTGERHSVEHDVFHVSHTLAKQCIAHANALAPFLERYGGTEPAPVKEEPEPWQNVIALLRRKMSEAVGRREVPGLLLLRDLSNLYLAASECEISWVMAMQAAQVVRDAELLDVVTRCDEQLVDQIRWLRTRIKEASPQTLAVG